jgi:hypothetical protein
MLRHEQEFIQGARAKARADIEAAKKNLQDLEAATQVKGRRSNLTPQLQRRICRLLERGHTVATVCASLGISDRSFHTYCERNIAFLAATQRARAQGRVRLVDSILDDRDWRGKAWYLERTAPAEFRRVEERGIPLPEVPEREKRIDVAFIVNLPNGTQRRISEEEAQKLAALFPVKTLPEPEPETEPEPESHWGGDVGKLGGAYQEPDGEQPLP